MSQEEDFFEGLLVQPVPRRVRRVSPGPDPFAQAPVTVPREPLAIEGRVVVVPAALMKCMQSSCSGRHEGRLATVVACYSSGERCPSCDECARYWLGLRPDATWIESLESYRDPLQEASEVLDAKRTSQPPPPALEAPQAAIKGQAVSAEQPGQRKHLAAWAWGVGSAFTVGVFLFLGNAKAGGPGAVIGVLLILASLLTGAIAVAVMIAKDTRAAHAKWLAQHTPEQQAQIHAAEKAALWTGTAVAAVALHEHNKRTRQATIAAAQVNRADYAAQRQHRELIDAIQGQQPPAADEQTAATQRMLAQSVANRNNRGWS